MKNYREVYALNLGIILLFVLGISLVENFLWEALHAVYLYQRHDMDAANYVPMLLYVSSVDGLIVSGLYLGVGVIWRDLLWIKRFLIYQMAVFLFLGIAVASIIEYRAVFLDHRWLYKEAMPTLFGIGLSPLAQLSFTGLLAVWLTKKILYGPGLLAASKKGPMGN